jgi:hypothetical protein
MNAPRPVIILIDAQGDRGCWRRSKPEDRRHHKAIRRAEPWRPQRAIPAGDRDELRRAAEEMRRLNRARVEEMLAEARMCLRAA